MNKLKFSSKSTQLLSVITFMLVCIAPLGLLSKPALSDENNNQNIANKSIQKINFIKPTLEKEPENRGAPSDRRGAGTRGECKSTKNPTIALVPMMPRIKQGNSNTPASEFVLGLTSQEYPTFWFYVPYAPNEATSVKFVILDEKKNPLTPQPIPINLKGTPGVISVKLPNGKPLEMNKYYHWYLLINCNEKSQSEDIAVEGLVKRIAPKPDLQSSLASATPREQASIYAKAGIWQDALTLLGELRRSKPEDTALNADWKQLLESVGLKEEANEQIAPCCGID
ncbi:MAG: DUF928 domain-containing protein [Scytonematopsis contorta HA4267-MV1]|jgi:hypothetical protein|nr:DUF928 domain-containing protein [Scytonematopsis contorta HA4267-MV1]